MRSKINITMEELEELRNGNSIEKDHYMGDYTIKPPCETGGHEFRGIRSDKDGSLYTISRTCRKCGLKQVKWIDPDDFFEGSMEDSEQ